MYSKESHKALLGIARNVRFAREFIEGYDEQSFAADARTLYAVTRCLEIISEAARRLDDGIFERHPRIEWRAIKGAGNIYRHAYRSVSARILWATVEVLDELEIAVRDEILRAEAAKQAVA